MTGRRFIADAGPTDVEIYLDTDGTREPRPYARYRLADLGGTPDDVLAVHRWQRIGPWFRGDDTPADHKVCAVEPTAELARLVRDQEIGDERRGSV